MADYTSVDIIPGMVGELDGAFYQAESIADGIVTAIKLDDETLAQLSETDIKTKATNNELWVAWPPSLRQENMV